MYLLKIFKAILGLIIGLEPNRWVWVEINSWMFVIINACFCINRKRASILNDLKMVDFPIDTTISHWRPASVLLGAAMFDLHNTSISIIGCL